MGGSLGDQGLEEHGLAKRGTAGVTVLTVAGALTLLSDPTPAVGRCSLEVLRFTEEEESRHKRTVLTGPVDVVVREGSRIIMDELGQQSVLTPESDVWRYLGSPRSSSVRLWSMPLLTARTRTTAPTLASELRPGAVRVVSPGHLPEPVTIENMRSQQAARNPRVLGFLRRSGLAEDLGLGVDRMEDAMQAELLEPPEFEETAQSVVVTLRNRGSVTLQERAWVHELMTQNSLEPRDAVVVLHAVRDGVTTNDDRPRASPG